MDKEELIKQAVESHEAYLSGVAELKERRQRAFRRALTGPVSTRELGQRVGLSNAQVSRITTGHR